MGAGRAPLGCHCRQGEGTFESENVRRLVELLKMEAIRKFLFRAYWKAESIIVPGLKSSQYSYYEILRRIVTGTEWLDMGCGHQVFAEWMTKEQAEVTANCRDIVGIDLDWAGLRAHPAISRKVFGDLTRLPFNRESFTLVSANMVVEHLDDPEAVLREIHRILGNSGKFIFHTPNYNGWPTRIASLIPESVKKKMIWLLEKRKEEDVFPTYYRMNTEGAIRRLAARTGFSVQEIALVSTSCATVVLGPVAWIELLFIRLIRGKSGAKFRSNIIAVLSK